MRTHKNHSSQLEPLTNSSEHIAQFISKLRKIILLVLLALAFDGFIGQPSLRTHWKGFSSDPRSAYHCKMVTITGEVHYFNHYRSLISIVKPDRPLGMRAYTKLRDLVVEGLAR